MATPASEHIALSDNDALFYDREFLTSVLTIIGKMCQIIAMGPRSLESPEGSFAFSVWQNSYYIQSVLLGLGSGYSIQDLSRQILPNLNALVDITILPDPALVRLRMLYGRVDRESDLLPYAEHRIITKTSSIISDLSGFAKF